MYLPLSLHTSHSLTQHNNMTVSRAPAAEPPDSLSRSLPALGLLSSFRSIARSYLLALLGLPGCSRRKPPRRVLWPPALPAGSDREPCSDCGRDVTWIDLSASAVNRMVEILVVLCFMVHVTLTKKHACRYWYCTALMRI